MLVQSSKIRLLFVVSLFVLSATLAAGPPPTISLVRGPYLQQPTDHSMVVVWATKEPAAAEVHYSTGVGPTLTAPAVSRLVPAAATGLPFDYYQHEAALSGLASAASYSYQPFNGGVAAAPAAAFRTAPATASGSVSFIAFGDSGTGSVEQRQLAGVMSRDSFDVALHVGDIAYGTPDGTGDATYATYQSYFFDIYNWLSTRGFAPVEGNHDSRPSNNNGQAYLDLFSLPTNGASAAFPDHAERYYSFDYGPVHVIALDTEFAFLDTTRRAEQLRWLEADLASTAEPWKIAVLHRAPYSSGGEHGSALDVRAAFGPLFERYGVDLVLAGHEHDYERTVPIRESSVLTDHAVTYIVTGGGGGPLYQAATSTWTAFSTSQYEYVKLTADECTLTLNTIGLDGTAFDGTTMTHCVTSSAPPSVALTSPVDGATATAPGTFALTADASDPDGTVTRVDFFAGSTLVGNAFAAPFTASWTNVPAGTYALTAVATDNSGMTATSAPITVTVTAAGLPEGWSSADVGSTGAAGRTTVTAGEFSVTGAGADVWNTADAFQYAYRTLTGDGSIVARVASVQNVASWTKAGVMIRNSLSPSAAHAFMLISAGKGVAFQRRRSDGASSLNTAGAFTTAPRWVKLTRAGNTIAAYESADGVAWSQVGADTFVMGTTVDVGLAVSSHVDGVLATAVFDHVSIATAAPPQPALPPGWTSGDIGTTGAAGSASAANGLFTIKGAGADVWGTSDAFQYAYTALSGDGTIVARVASVQNIANWTKAGVMIRNSLSPSAAQAFMLVSAGKGVAFQRRVSDGAATVSTSGTFTTAPRWVKLTRAGNTITAFESAGGTTWTQVGSDTFQMGSTVFIGLAVSSHVTGVLATATFDNVSIAGGDSQPPPSSPLPAGWAQMDVGAVPFAGAAKLADGTFTVTGSGADIWGTSDQFHYAYQPLTGDATVVVRVASVQNVDRWVKAGIMIRETLADDSAHASVFVSAAKGVAFQRRATAGGETVHTAGTLTQAPRWIKLSRSGDAISAYESSDGMTWALVGTDTIPMAGTVYVGLAVTSHTTSAAATCTFDGWSIQY